MHLKKAGQAAIVTVPVHSGKTLKPGTLASVLRQAGLSAEEFRALL